MDKYEVLTAMAKALDERDHLREVNDVLERDLHEYKVATGSGELTPAIAKLAEYGRRKLFDTAFKPDWYDVGVKELEGELYPNMTLSEWSGEVFRANGVPKDFSVAETHQLCERLVVEEYDRKFASEKELWLEEHKGE